MVILIDTREQRNKHITDYLTSKKIKYKTKKLNYGDYSFKLPVNPEMGIMRDVYFSNSLTIERKASLEELSNCLAQDRSRFENELIKSQGSKLILMIEEANYSDIITHSYRTQYNPKSFMASLITFRHRYSVSFNFINKKHSGNFIYYHCYYWLREYLK